MSEALFAEPGIRPAAKADSWYPAEPQRLQALLDDLLDQAQQTELGEHETVRALIVPHAAYAYSGATAASAYRAVQGAKYQRVILLGPAHRSGGEPGVSVLNVQAYATPLGSVPLDLEAIASLRQSPLVHSYPSWDAEEHSLEIQLPFLQRVLAPGWQLVPVLIGNLQGDDYAQLAQALGPLLDEHTLLVVSTDFTHYGAAFRYLPFPVDEQTEEHLRELDLGAFDEVIVKDPEALLEYQQETDITICGYQPLALLLHLLPADAQVRLLRYATSGRMLGDFHHSVSYIAALVTQSAQAVSAETQESPVADGTLSEGQMRELYDLAQRTVRASVLKDDASLQALQGKVESIPDEFLETGAAFVTLWKGEWLRGCIGTVQAFEPLYKSVIRGAEGAALHDPRFQPVKAEELSDLHLEISVLTSPTPIDSVDECVIGRDGLVLNTSGRQSVYLPEVMPKMGWDCREAFRQLSLKAGLPEDAWKDDGAELRVFTSQKLELHDGVIPKPEI